MYKKNQIANKTKLDVQAAFYKSGEIKPCIIRLKGHTFRIKKINHIWREKNGNGILTYFSLTDGINVFVVSFDHNNATWLLENVYMDGDI